MGRQCGRVVSVNVGRPREIIVDGEVVRTSIWKDPVDGRVAVRAGHVWALDGNAYFSRPGPRVVDGIELLASLLHPDRVVAPAGTRAIRLATPSASPSVA